MPEHQNIEWKELWRDEYLKWICAFANSQGGTLIIGKRDDGSIKGIENSKKLLESLPNKISHTLGLICDVNLKTEGELEYIEITVEPSSSAVAYDGRYFKRTGSTTMVLTGQALSDFLLKKSNIDWDSVIVDSATINDLDETSINYFKQYAIASGRIPSLTSDTPIQLILENLDMINENGELRRAALILFGKKPRKIEYTAYLKIGKFGNSSTELLDQDDIEVNAINLADKTLEVLNAKYLSREINYEGLHRVEKVDYPIAALREVLFNAIIHRSYSTMPIEVRIYPDRIRIFNFGSLPSGLSVEKLKVPHSSVPRNRLMATTFYKAGFIETWGRGTIKVIEECKKHGLPEPQIEETQGGVAVTIFKDIYDDQYLSRFNLNDRQKQTITYIKKNGSITTGEHSDLFSVGSSTSKRDLSELLDLGMIKSEGKGRTTRYLIDVYGYKQG